MTNKKDLLKVSFWIKLKCLLFGHKKEFINRFFSGVIKYKCKRCGKILYG